MSTNIMATVYDLNKIKFATDEITFQRAVDLYENSKVTDVKEELGVFTALVLGTKPYDVCVSARRYDDGSCTCYLGKKDVLCKHMVALALHVVMNGRPLGGEDKVQRHQVKCSGRRAALDKEELAAVKKSVTESLRHIKPYTGPSRTWFANQGSLQEGCNRLSAVVSDLPVDKDTAVLLVNLLLRLDKKLQTGGVDDSNGIVSGFMNEVVQMLIEYARIDPACIKTFELLAGSQTCFGWEEPLVRILDQRKKL